MKQLFLLYKTTNTTNGKIYIGKHKTYDVNDGYMGSGKLLKRAIRKYGIDAFVREIISFYETEDDLNEAESQIVDEKFCQDPDTYNLCVGGNGGFSYINRSGLQARKGNFRENPDIQQKASTKGLSAYHKRYKEDPEFREYMIDIKRKRMSGNKFFAGKSHSEETKAKMSAKKKDTGVGTNNSQYGSFWITNGIDSRKCYDGVTPEGWKRGRKIVR